MNQIESLAVRMNAARLVIADLRNQMRALRCEHEIAMDFVTDYSVNRGPMYDPHGRKYTWDCDDAKPCWKGSMEDCGDSWGRKEFVAFGDNRDGGWCDPCKAREKLRKPLSVARLRLAGLKSAFWRVAAKLAA